MHRHLVVVALCVGLLWPSSARALDVVGNINTNTIWTTADSPVVLIGDVTVAPQATLTIEPGVVVEAAASDLLGSGLDNGRVELIVLGSLVANGTVTDPIVIRGQSAGAGSWYGISLEPTAGTSSLTHVTIEDAEIGLWVRTTSALTLSDAALSACSAGVLWQSTLAAQMERVALAEITNVGIQLEDDGAAGGTANLSDLDVRTCGDAGVAVGARVSATVERSLLAFNGTGLRAAADAALSCVNNVIAGNKYFGLDLTQSSTHSFWIVNNTVDLNVDQLHLPSSAGTGLKIRVVTSAPDFIVRNNVVTNHGSYGIQVDSATHPSLDHNDVWGNGSDYSAGLSAGTGSISANPLYTQGIGGGSTWIAVSDPLTVSWPGHYYDNSWTFTQLGAFAMRVSFDWVSTESCCDHVRIYDINNTLVQTISGSFSGLSSTVYGGYVRVRLSTDGSVSSQGFSLFGYEYQSAAFNYRLQSTSPVIDVGNDLNAPLEDADGSTRPYDGDVNGTATTDMGAYEWHENIPPVAVAGPDLIVLPNTPVDFNAVASFDPDGSITAYEWDFDDGSPTESTVLATHTYSGLGTYVVTLTVWDDQGASGTDTVTVEVTDNLPPVADAGPDQYVSAASVVTLNGGNSSDPDGTIVSYEWDFGDNSPTGSGPSVTHVWAADGVYTVTLTVTDNLGGTDTDTASIVVGTPNPNEPPVASTGGPYSGGPGADVVFDGSASVDPDGSIVSWEWNFGDNVTGSGETTSHAYSAPGNYLVILTVTDNDGAMDDDSTLVSITTPGNDPPMADAGDNVSGGVGESLLFDGSGSTDADGTIVSYEWDFGDNATGSGAQASHAYDTPGTYLVRLTVVDDDGALGQDVLLATVGNGTGNQPPVADAGSSVTVDPGEVVLFDGSGSSDPDGTVESYAWDFGDETSDTGEFVQHAFDVPGAYLVTLVVTDDRGATDDDVVLVTVREPGGGASDSGGCNTSGSGAPSVPLLLLAVGVLVALLRRRP